MAFRHLKKQLIDLLGQDDLQAALSAMAGWPPRQVINPLFGLLYHGDMRVRWHAVSAMGSVTARLAETDIEAARVIMRRLMWNLNDESGGIGWGSPEAMGEIMARHEELAREYAAILVSYLDPQGNYLEHERLQQGSLWGFGRLAHARPGPATAGVPFLKPFLSSPLADLRGLAAWAAAAFGDISLQDFIRSLRSDPAEITLYTEGHLKRVAIADLARAALERT